LAISHKPIKREKDDKNAREKSRSMSSPDADTIKRVEKSKKKSNRGDEEREKTDWGRGFLSSSSPKALHRKKAASADQPLAILGLKVV
jgi:hypothetical protein